MAQERQRNARRTSKRRTKRSPRKAAAIGDIHLRGLREVAAALQRELARIGLTPTPAVVGLLSWRDIVPTSSEPGTSVKQHFTGRTAAVIDAAVRVEHTYQTLTGPVSALLDRLRQARAAMRSAWSLSSDHGTEITASIHNADLTRRARVAFGAEPTAAPAFDFDLANKVLLSCIHAADDLDEVIASLEARMPDVITAGFYKPRGTGCVGHFAMLLSENGRSSAEIAEILGQTPERSSLTFPETFSQKRAAVNDNAKHLVNRAKARLTPKDLRGTGGASRDVPPGEFTCVITTLNAGANQRISGYVAGRETLFEVVATAASDTGAA
jgi:hypothetical protein